MMLNVEMETGKVRSLIKVEGHEGYLRLDFELAIEDIHVYRDTMRMKHEEFCDVSRLIDLTISPSSESE